MAGHSRSKNGVASARLWPGHPRLFWRDRTPRRGCPAQGRAWRFVLQGLASSVSIR